MAAPRVRMRTREIGEKTHGRLLDREQDAVEAADRRLKLAFQKKGRKQGKKY